MSVDFSSLQPAEKRWKLTEGTTWEILAKGFGSFLVVGVVVAIACTLILYMFVSGGIVYGRHQGNHSNQGMNELGGALGGMAMGMLGCFVAVFIGHMAALGIYERWRGCYLKEN